MAALDVQVLMISSVALLTKMFLTLMVQGGKRFEAGSRPPEDARFGALAKGKSQTYGVPSDRTDSNQESLEVKNAKIADIRWQRIVLNDLENIPLGLFVCLMSVISNGNVTANSVLILSFTISRIGHTIAYAYCLQPYRSYAWGIAVISVFAIGINGIVGSFTQ